MAADPAFFHRDGSGKFHAYDAATNALLEEAYRTQKTCRLPVRGMHLEVRFGAKATSDRVAVPPLSRIVQVNCGASNTPTRVVLRVEAGEDPAAVYCALGAAADTSEKKLRHRYARLVALDGSAEADVHILRREGAAHRCRFADGAEHVLSLRCRERAEDPHARPSRTAQNLTAFPSSPSTPSSWHPRSRRWRPIPTPGCSGPFAVREGRATSFPRMMAVGGFFFDFECILTRCGSRGARRGRGDGVRASTGVHRGVPAQRRPL